MIWLRPWDFHKDGKMNRCGLSISIGCRDRLYILINICYK